MSQLGFEKRAGAIFTSTLSDGVIGWIGFNSASHKRPAGEVLFNPVVGVRYESVQRIVEELLEVRAPITPTVSTPLQHLMPADDRRDWCFSERRDDAGQLADLVRCIGTYGMPFMESLVTLLGIERHSRPVWGISPSTNSLSSWRCWATPSGPSRCLMRANGNERAKPTRRRNSSNDLLRASVVDPGSPGDSRTGRRSPNPGRPAADWS